MQGNSAGMPLRRENGQYVRVKRRVQRATSQVEAVCKAVAIDSPNRVSRAQLEWRCNGKASIRKLDYALRHDNIQGGVVIGFVRGCHEHIWTDEDAERFIILSRFSRRRCPELR